MTRGFASVSVQASLCLTAVLALFSACGHPVGPASCTDPRDCAAGETCNAGLCVLGGATSCVTDLDCDPSQNQVCSQGVCIAADDVTNTGGGSCTATADCPIDQFCNTATGICSALLDGWCRQDSQCSGDTSLCNNVLQGGSAFPGRCVACVDDGDCGGGTCVSPGVCQQDAGCKPNSSPVVGGACRCDPGFQDDGTGNCLAVAEGEGDVVAEGEGDVVAEGEGDTGTAGECTTATDCFGLYDINWTCEGTQCVCDVAWLDFDCGGDYDVASCACGGSGGTTTGSPSTENDLCLDDTDCGTLSCIFGAGAGAFDFGACKQVCDTNADCLGGLSCMSNLFADGSGICATPRAKGQTCESSVYAVDVSTNSLCDGSGADVLDCFAGTCEQVCDWSGNTGAELSCSGGDSCGFLEYRVEVDSSVAVCE